MFLNVEVTRNLAEIAGKIICMNIIRINFFVLFLFSKRKYFLYSYFN